MLDKFLYMATLDEINPSLPEGELTIRRIAKHGSRVMGFIGWVMMLPFIIVPSFIDKSSGNFLSFIFINGVVKPHRYIWYQVIYWPLKIPVMLLSKRKEKG